MERNFEKQKRRLVHIESLEKKLALGTYRLRGGRREISDAKRFRMREALIRLQIAVARYEEVKG